MFEGLQMSATADCHIHLRDGAMCEAITPLIANGGVDMVFVMPNLVPPITTVDMAVKYRSILQGLAPQLQFLMSLYLHPSLSREEIAEAKKQGVYGIKAYPAGVTTHSSAGVVDWQSFYPIFEEMEKQDLVLNLHGECPSGEDITVLNAEEKFLPTLLQIHADFPRLRIILEHCSTEAAINTVKACGPNVCGTITAHHLFLTVDDWAGNSLHWCKPAAKSPQDRRALLLAAASGNPKFFFGSDSAPHPVHAKLGSLESKGKQAAGVFTTPYATQLVLEAFEQACAAGVLQERDMHDGRVEDFLSTFGRRFYSVGPTSGKIQIGPNKSVDIEDVRVGDNSEDAVVSFRSGRKTWPIHWVS